jgi:hypothetical protein
MTELERQLRALAQYVELPTEHDLAPAILARISRKPSPRFRQAVALGLALVALAIGIAFAVPPARGAIIRFLGFGGVRIEFVDRLPEAPARTSLDLGRRTTLEGARAAVPYSVLTSALLGSPEEVHVRGDQVGFVWRRGGKVTLLLTEFPGRARPEFVKKLLQPGTRIAPVDVGGSPGYWITGKPHAFFYVDERGRVIEKTLYLAGNTLLWQRGRLTLRLEGRVTLAEALRIARSFR